MPRQPNSLAQLEASDDHDPDVFETLVAAALAGLPAPFCERLDTVAVVIEDGPTAAELAQAGAPDLLGLYTGVPRTAYGASQAAMPSKITIYQGPHLRVFRDPSRWRVA